MLPDGYQKGRWCLIWDLFWHCLRPFPWICLVMTRLRSISWNKRVIPYISILVEKFKILWLLRIETKLATADPKFSQWGVNNCIILGRICNSMEEQIYNMFMYHETIQGLWYAPMELYAHAHNKSQNFMLYYEISYNSQAFLGCLSCTTSGSLGRRNWLRMNFWATIPTFLLRTGPSASGSCWTSLFYRVGTWVWGSPNSNFKYILAAQPVRSCRRWRYVTTTSASTQSHSFSPLVDGLCGPSVFTQ